MWGNYVVYKCYKQESVHPREKCIECSTVEWNLCRVVAVLIAIPRVTTIRQVPLQYPFFFFFGGSQSIFMYAYRL